MVLIRPVQIDVVGVHPRWSRLLIVHVRLQPHPPRRWRELFAQAGADLPAQPMHAPALDGAIVTITPPDDSLEAEVAHVEARVRLANDRFEAEMAAGAGQGQGVSAPIQPPEHETQVENTEITARIDAARRKARGMSQIFQSGAWLPESTTRQRPEDVARQAFDEEIDF